MEALTAALAGESLSRRAQQQRELRRGQFKSHRAVVDQEARREAILQRQRSERRANMDRLRDLFPFLDHDEDEAAGVDSSLEPVVEVDAPLAEVPPAGQDAALDESDDEDEVNEYAAQIMTPEPLYVMPGDAAAAWTCVLAPVGRRTLIVCQQGQTAAHSQGQTAPLLFPSRLPGGGAQGAGRRRQGDLGPLRLKDAMRICPGPPVACVDNCILDALYCPDLRTFFVLDLLCWRSHPFVEMDFECRSFFLESKFEECPRLAEIGADHPYAFVPLPRLPCEPGTIALAAQAPRGWHLAGLLLYYKEGIYEGGTGPSPLVLWLELERWSAELGIEAPFLPS